MTIAELAKREAALVEELQKVREEIASRAGEVDQPRKTARKTTK